MQFWNNKLLSTVALNLVATLLGGALTLLVQKGSGWLKARRIEKKFPIAGLYLTKYTDKNNRVTELLRLRQSGRRIAGENILNRENDLNARKWLFEGEVRSEGYVHGSYKPEAPFDKGFGAFFLKLGKQGDMEGYWIGKDADESKIQFGEYSFLKQPPFVIVPVEDRDVSAVLRIAEERLGDAYINRSDLRTDVDNIAYCAKVKSIVVGFATARVVETEKLLRRIEEPVAKDLLLLRPIKRRIEGESSVGHVSAAAITRSVEGRGLGAELIGRCIEGLEERSMNIMVATAWKSPDGFQAASILECRGFQKVIDIPGYWEKDSLTNGYSCPACGMPPCHCTAALYVRNRH